MNPKYRGIRKSAQEAQRIAHMIAFAPVVFQVSRLMAEYGIFGMLEEAGRKKPAGMTVAEVASAAGLSEYAAKILLESSLTAGTVFLNDGRYTISKTGWFLLNDDMVRSDMNFNQDVNYRGLFHLDEALRTGKPAGLKELGDWPTLYEGLSEMPANVRKSWFGFDHFYSDSSFGEALEHLKASAPASILDIGRNTGRFALKCVSALENVKVTVMDLPKQIRMLKENIAGHPGAERIGTYSGDLLDPATSIPGGFDIVWMSQFLDCFSEEQVISILGRVAASIGNETEVFIMETLWDRQKFETASFDLTQTSVYFTAIANGNSKMFSGGDLFAMIEKSGLRISEVTDGLGYGHSLVKCERA